MSFLAWCWAHKAGCACGLLALAVAVLALLLRRANKIAQRGAQAVQDASTKAGVDAVRQEVRGENLSEHAAKLAAEDEPLAAEAGKPIPPVQPDPHTLSAAEHVRAALEEARRGDK